MFKKETIREQMRRQRLQMRPEDVKKASAACTAQLLSLTEYQEARTILLYASVHNEVDTSQILTDALARNKMVGMPVTYPQGRMEFYSVFDPSQLQPGQFGIPEPPTDLLIEEREALLIVPALAFDRRKNRVGQGGGYYDRYLERYPERYRIGLAYEYQIVDAFPQEDCDVPVDLIITEKQIII